MAEPRIQEGKIKRIKVLYVSDTFLPRVDGVVRFITETVKRLSPLFEVSFLVPKMHGSEEAAKKLKGKPYLCPVSKFKIEEFPITKPKNNIIKEAVDDADVVFVNTLATLGASALAYAHSKGKPTIAYVHSIDWELFAYATKFPKRAMGTLKPIIRRFYSRANLLLAANRDIVYELKKNRIQGPFVIVELGVDLKKFKPDRVARVQMRKKLGLANNYVVGFHGRLSKEKNIEMLYKSFKLLKIHVPNAKLLVVGDGPERDTLKGLPDVIVTGFVPDPEKYLPAMDVYVLPSETETTGLSLMEAMACGLPAISSAVGSIPSYVKDKQNGILINPKDLSPALIAKAIRTIHDSPVSVNKMKENASKTVRKFYTWKTTVDKLEKIFKKIGRVDY